MTRRLTGRKLRSGLPNFSGYGITRLSSFFKTNLANYDYFMRIGEIGGDGTLYYIFFDENGVWSDSSPVSVWPSTTPTSTTWGDIKETSNWGFNAPICQITGLEVYANNGSSIAQGDIATAGVGILEPINGKTAAFLKGARGFNYNTAGGLPELANDQNWSQLIVCNPDNDNDQHSIASVTMSSSATSYLDIFCDRRANKVGANIVTASGTYEFNFIDTQNDSLTKNIALTFDGTSKDVDLYLNGANQESQTIVGTYTNTIFRIGGQHSTATKPLTGFWQMHIVANEKWDDTKTANLNNLVNSILLPIDADAQALFTAGSITDPIHKYAGNYAITAFKKANIWNKFKSLILVLGGTAYAHKLNAKDLRDLDEAFRLTFSGTITHDDTGMQGDGSTGVANMHIIASDDLLLDDNHIAFFSRTDGADESAEMGTYGSGGNNALLTTMRWSDDLDYSANNVNGFPARSYTATSGLYICSRLSSTEYKLLRNGVITTYTDTSDGLDNREMYLLGANTADGTQHSIRKCVMASVGFGLTDEEMQVYKTIADNFQAILGR